MEFKGYEWDSEGLVEDESCPFQGGSALSHPAHKCLCPLPRSNRTMSQMISLQFPLGTQFVSVDLCWVLEAVVVWGGGGGGHTQL